jgi:hypothetical protein
LVLTIAQLQRLASAAHFPAAFTFEMDFLKLVETLHDFTRQQKVHIVLKHQDTIFVAVNGEVSTTKQSADRKTWRVKTAAYAAVWWLQNPTKPFAALSSAVIEVL